MNNTDNNENTSLLYLAICSKKQAPGVIKKIEGIVQGAISCGYNSNILIIEPGSIQKYFIFLYKLALAREMHIFIRYINRIGLLIFIAGIVLKIRGRKLYIDIPTPMQNHLRETLGKKDKVWLDYVDTMLIIVQGCIPFLSAHKLIQYAEEGKWYSVGVRQKTIKIGNGICVASIPCRQSAPKWPSRDLNLVAVGTIAFWHGWDRLIDAIRMLQKDPHVNFNINFTIIGDGPDRANLQNLVLMHALSDRVRFLGMLYGQDLYDEYKNAHFGVGSLGWSRVGIEEASPLKVREYLAAGLPVITSTMDPDFKGNENFILKVSNDENLNSIIELIKLIATMNIPSPKVCRSFAESHLDFTIKMRSILPAME